MATKTINPLSGASAAEVVMRRFGTTTVTCHGTDPATSDVLDKREYQSIAVKPPASATTITVYAAEAADGTFVLVDNIGTNGVITCPASKWTTLDPTKIAPLGFLKFLASTAGTMSVMGQS